MNECIHADELWFSILEKFGLNKSNTVLVIPPQEGSQLSIKITFLRNRNKRGRYRYRLSDSSSSSRQSILLEAYVYRANGNSTGSGVSKKIQLWKDENIPRRIAIKRIAEIMDAVTAIKQELGKDLSELMIRESKEKEFEERLAKRYNCKIETHGPDRATLKFKNFDISINAKEQVTGVYMRERDSGLFVWELAPAMEDIVPIRSEKRTSRLFRLSHPQESSRIPKNEEV